jgi:hypothetical protein
VEGLVPVYRHFQVADSMPGCLGFHSARTLFRESIELGRYEDELRPLTGTITTWIKRFIETALSQQSSELTVPHFRCALR